MTVSPLFLIFMLGALAGSIFVGAGIALSKRYFPSAVGGLLVGALLTCIGTYLAILTGFSIAEQIVLSQVEPQWRAQGHTDNGPSAFVAVGMLAMPFVAGAFVGGSIISVVATFRRARKE